MQKDDYSRGLAVLTRRGTPVQIHRLSRVGVGQATSSIRLNPIDGGRIPTTGTRTYLAVRDPTEREPAGHVHAGVDIGTRTSTPVRAPEGGVVEAAATEGGRGTGWRGYAPVVYLRGDSGVWHVLAHLSGGPLAVAEGQRVEAGAVVGRTGSEHHVHWEVRTRPRGRALASEVTIDPSIWLAGGEESAPPFSPPMPVTHPTPAPRNGAIVAALGIGVVGGLITWAITRD